MELCEADLTNDESLKNAVAGSEYVLHVASPFFFGDSEAELVTPAVEGTKSIMRACKESGVKRCVITSSIASVIYATGKPDNAVLTEEDWSDPTNPGMGMYPRSKYLAEKAAWDFHAALPESERFDLITILPGFVLGPALRTESSVSIDFCRDILTGKGSCATSIPYRCFPMVDVRDVALAHMNALKKPEAANKRFLCVNESVWFKDLIMPIADRYKPEGWPVPTEVAAAPEGDYKVLRCDNSASKQILGMQYRAASETMLDMASKMIELGAVSKPDAQEA